MVGAGERLRCGHRSVAVPTAAHGSDDRDVEGAAVPPVRQSRPGSARRAPATRSRSRFGCSARCSGRSITEQAGEAIFDLVERLRLAAIAFRQDERAGGPGAARGRARRARAGGRRGGHHRLLAVLPAREPRRGAGARPGTPSPRARRPRRPARRLGGGGGRPTAAGRPARGRPRCDLRSAAHHAGPHRAPDRGAATDDAGRPPPLRGAPRAAGRPSADAIRGSRGASPAARGDHAPVADHRPPRRSRPNPLDEVRTAMAIFDATLFTLVPRLVPDASMRSLDAPTAGRRDRRPAAARRRPFLRLGIWIGGDRDGNPGVTADMTERTLRIQADHVLHGYEAVAMRLMQTVSSATTPHERVAAAPLATRLARDAEELPETDRQLRRRFPDEPYRQRFGFIAERLRRTRAALTGEAGARTGALRGRRRPRRGARARSQDALVARWARRGSRGASSPSCAGSSGRSGSTWRRSRSASTPTVHRAALAALDAGRAGRPRSRPA